MSHVKLFNFHSLEIILSYYLFKHSNNCHYIKLIYSSYPTQTPTTTFKGNLISSLKLQFWNKPNVRRKQNISFVKSRIKWPFAIIFITQLCLKVIEFVLILTNITLSFQLNLNPNEKLRNIKKKYLQNFCPWLYF